LPICVMGCVVSSPISTNPRVSRPFSMTSHVVWSSKIHMPNIVIWYTSYHWICHVLHHKQLFITLIANWCTIPLLQLSISCIMLIFIRILCHVHRFPGIVAVWVVICLLTYINGY
jgi:hypothetical protein